MGRSLAVAGRSKQQWFLLVADASAQKGVGQVSSGNCKCQGHLQNRRHAEGFPSGQTKAQCYALCEARFQGCKAGEGKGPRKKARTVMNASALCIYTRCVVG